MAQNLLQVQQAEARRQIHKLTRFEHQLAAGIGDPNEFEDSGTPIYVYDDSLTCRADCVFTAVSYTHLDVYKRQALQR